MDRIKTIADRHELPIIEDAAQAHGARYRGKRVGQFGKIACFSFYPSKNLGAYGEGGALVTNDALIARRARSLRDHAQSQKYLHAEIGYNYRMDNLQAEVLTIKHLGYRVRDLPVTEKLCEQCLSLPIYPELSKEKIFTVASILLNLER